MMKLMDVMWCFALSVGDKGTASNISEKLKSAEFNFWTWQQAAK